MIFYKNVSEYASLTVFHHAFKNKRLQAEKRHFVFLLQLI